MGRCCMEWSPEIVAVTSVPANAPVIKRMPVPELPTSKAVDGDFNAPGPRP